MLLASLSVALTGDPVEAGSEVRQLHDVARLAGIEAETPPVAVELAPGAAAVLCRSAAGQAPTVTWIHLPHRPRLALGAGGTAVALAMTAPVARLGPALQLVARARACFRAAALVERSRALRTREELVRLLAPVEAEAGEIGSIARLTQAVTQAPSPLQREMARVSRVITAIALGLGVAFFTVGVLTGLLPPSDGLAFALGVIVANVPEGLLPPSPSEPSSGRTGSRAGVPGASWPAGGRSTGGPRA